MNTSLLAILALPFFSPGLPTNLAASEPAAGDSITLAPRAGLVLRKRFELTKESSSEESSEDSTTSTESAASSTLVVLDSVLAANDERVTRLERTYEQVGQSQQSSAEGDFGANEMSRDAGCELVDALVLFEWDEDDEAYGISSKAEDELIEDLRFDLDLAGFLPAGEVDEGDEWELEGEAFEQVIDFMDGLPLDWSSEGSGGGGGGHGGGVQAPESEPAQVERTVVGEVTLRYAGTRSVDGATLAVIELDGELEIEQTVDLSQAMEGHSFEMHQESTETHAIEGELLWNIAGGHLHSLELEIEVEGESATENIVAVGGQEFESGSDATSSGTTSLSVSFERVEG